VAPALAPEAILKALRERIDCAFLPRPLVVVDALPRNATGKLPREGLLKLAAEALARESKRSA
jgi:acyl-coenzyme A synthetase/AMP-(fatty) acid ligase